jgi:hypothetical protein
MKKEGEFTKEGMQVLESARQAGEQLIEEGKMHRATLERFSRPLISEGELREMYNRLV